MLHASADGSHSYAGDLHILVHSSPATMQHEWFHHPLAPNQYISHPEPTDKSLTHRHIRMDVRLLSPLAIFHSRNMPQLVKESTESSSAGVYLRSNVSPPVIIDGRHTHSLSLWRRPAGCLCFQRHLVRIADTILGRPLSGEPRRRPDPPAQ